MFSNRLIQATDNIAAAPMKMERLYFNGNTVFELKGNPDEEGIMLLIVNGVLYFDESDIEYDSATKTLTWVSSIQLSADDDILALYSEAFD